MKYEIISEDEWNQIISEREESELSLIDELIFNDYELVKDNIGVYYYSLIDNSKKAYNPVIKKTSDINIVFHQDINDEMIKNNIQLEVLTYNDKYYKVESIILTKLPILKLNYTAVFSDITEEDIVDMTMYLYDNREKISNRIITSTGTLKLRGSSSLNYPKKSYHLNLTKNSASDVVRGNDISLLGMRKDNDWILSALYSDNEKIRNTFSSQLWYDCCSNNNEYSINTGTEHKYVELLINGEYKGLYTLGYMIDEKQVNLSKDENGLYDEYLFKKIGWFEVEKNIMKENKLSTNYEIKSGLTDNDKAWELLGDSYRKLLYSEDKNVLLKSSSLSNSIDLYLFYNFVQGVDNVNDETIKNTYVILKKSKDGYKILFAPWDLDQTFGNIWNYDNKNLVDQYKVKVTDNRIMKINLVSSLLRIDDSEIRDEVKKRYYNLRDSYWNEDYIETLLSEYEEDIYGSGAFIRDKEKWPDGSYNDEEEMLSKFKDYVYNRIGYLDFSLNAILK